MNRHKARTKLLSRTEAKELDNDLTIPHRGCEDANWSVKSLMKSNLPAHKDQFVGVPLVTKEEAQLEATMLESSRRSGIPFTTPQPVKKKTAKLSSSKKATPKMRPAMRLPANKNEEHKLTAQELRESNSEHPVHKGITSIHQDLVALWQKKRSQEMFASMEFVQRAMNDVAFMAKKSNIHSHVFELGPKEILHVCIDQNSEECKQFKVLKFHTKRTQCDACEAVNKLTQKWDAVEWLSQLLFHCFLVCPSPSATWRVMELCERAPAFPE